MGFKIENIQNNKEKSEINFDVNKFLHKEISFFANSFSNKKKEDFYTELSVLLDAGLELKDALELIQEEQKNNFDNRLIEHILKKIISGINFSEALNQVKEFTPYEYFSVEVGEKTGRLDSVIADLGVFFKRRNEQKRMIINALSYPIIILSTAFLAMAFMLQYVVPMFADIFKQNNVELPWITIKIIEISSFLKSNYYLIFLFILTIFFIGKIFKNKDWYKRFFSKLYLKTPFIGEFLRKVRIAQFTQILSLLSSAKVPLLNGIQLAERMIDFYPLQKSLQNVENDILIGKTFSESLKKHSIFDSKMVSLIKVAEETNQMQVIFDRLTNQYNKDIEYKSKMLSSLLEPLIVLFLGIIVAVILIAMYIPMFKLSTVIG